MSYTYKWLLDEKGFNELDFKSYLEEELRKSAYVEKYLSPSIQFAKCGWNHCVYYILKNQFGDKDEFVALYPEEENQAGRFICVSGNSLGAISEAVWGNVFN